MLQKLLVSFLVLTSLSPTNAHAGWCDDSLEFLRKGIEYARHNPQAIANGAIVLGAAGIVTFFVYQGHTGPRPKYKLDDGEWEDSPVFPVVDYSTTIAPASPPASSITAMHASSSDSTRSISPELADLIADARNRPNKIVGLNSASVENEF